MAQKRPAAYYEKRYVAVEKVRVLVVFLERLYPGGLPEVAEVTGIPYKTLQGIKLEGKNDWVKKDLAARIVEAVMAHRHGDRSWSTFENEEAPRYATGVEQALPANFSRWRPAGGKVRRK